MFSAGPERSPVVWREQHSSAGKEYMECAKMIFFWCGTSVLFGRLGNRYEKVSDTISFLKHLGNTDTGVQKVPAVLMKTVCACLFIGCLFIFTANGFAGPTDSDVLASLAENGISKAITRMAETGGELAAAAEQFCCQKDAPGLEKARQAWKNAYVAWSGAAPFRFGPVKDLQLYKRIGLWRANDTIFKGATTSPDLADMLKAPEVRGYAGAEYILFGSADPGAEIACSHLVDVTSEIAALTARASQAWEEHKEGFINAGDGMPFMMESEAMSPVAAEILNSTEFLLRDRIGVPSNFFTGEAKPETLEAWHSGTTGEGMQATVSALKTALDGGAPASMVELLATKDGLVKKKNPELARAIRKDLDKVEKTLARINGRNVPVFDQVKKSSSTMKKLYKRLQKLEEKLIELSLGLELDVKAGLEAQFLRQQD